MRSIGWAYLLSTRTDGGLGDRSVLLGGWLGKVAYGDHGCDLFGRGYSNGDINVAVGDDGVDAIVAIGALFIVRYKFFYKRRVRYTSLP
jgi:hypothetical protein